MMQIRHFLQRNNNDSRKQCFMNYNQECANSFEKKAQSINKALICKNSVCCLENTASNRSDT